MLTSEENLASPKSATYENKHTKKKNVQLLLNKITPQHLLRHSHSLRKKVKFFFYHGLKLEIQENVSRLNVTVNDFGMTCNINQQGQKINLKKAKRKNSITSERELTIFMQISKPFCRPYGDSQPGWPIHRRPTFPYSIYIHTHQQSWIQKPNPNPG